jgi:hypothetical protein
MRNIIFYSFFFLIISFTEAQTTMGIGIYPTGTETGLGFRSGKNSKWILDARITKAVFSDNKTQSSFITEISTVCRIIRLEKVRFHLGLGVRTEWNFVGKNSKVGGIIPVGVEAFPFPFQNAGLFFEAAPYFTHDFKKSYNAGIRTVAGFVFYFPVKEKMKI